MKAKNTPPRITQTGFTMVELMVGLTIGLLAVMIIIQVISVFEAQQRNTSGSADAQTNGGIALYTIGRDMQMAGFPLVPFTNSPLECTAFTFGATGITGIAPALITDGVAAGTTNASDTITIRYGTSAMGGVPTQVSSLVGNAATVGTNLGCSVNDITILNTTSTCNLSSVTAILKRCSVGIGRMAGMPNEMQRSPTLRSVNESCVPRARRAAAAAALRALA